MHRAIAGLPGTLHRLSCTEHFAGDFPLWLAPEQVRVIPISDAHAEYAEGVATGLLADGVRASSDASSERMNAKIRRAQLMKVPYMLVVGDREAAEGTVSLRKRDGTRDNGLPVAAFQELVGEKIRTRAADL